MGGENFLNYFSAVHCSNVLKFDTLMHCASPETTEFPYPFTIKFTMADGAQVFSG